MARLFPHRSGNAPERADYNFGDLGSALKNLPEAFPVFHSLARLANPDRDFLNEPVAKESVCQRSMAPCCAKESESRIAQIAFNNVIRHVGNGEMTGGMFGNQEVT